MTDPATRRRGPYAKTAQRRRQILDAALRVFVARGYRAGSMREVATVAGMSLSNLTHHFKTKEDLLLALLERRDTDSVGQRTGTGVLVADVLAQARHNDTIPDLIALYTVLSAESLTEGHPGRGYFVERFTTVRHGFQEELEKLRDAGRLRPGVDPRLAAGSITALWDGIQLQWLLEPDLIDVTEHLRAFLDLIVIAEPAPEPDDPGERPAATE